MQPATAAAPPSASCKPTPVDEDSNLLFNIASCYEALGDIEAALEKYRVFLAARC
jgi:hypothetical protein